MVGTKQDLLIESAREEERKKRKRERECEIQKVRKRREGVEANPNPWLKSAYKISGI